MKTLKDYVELLASGRILSLSSSINDDFPIKFRSEFAKIAKEMDHYEDKKIGIVVDTFGGSVGKAFQIQTEIQAISQVYDTWIITGDPTSSAGVILTLSLPVEKRLAFANSRIYCHYARDTMNKIERVIESQFEYELKEQWVTMESTREYAQKWYALVARETKLNKKEAKDLFDNPRFINAREAVKLGFVSRILK